MRPERRQDGIDPDALAERMLALDEQAFTEFAEVFGARLRRLFLASGLPNYEAEDLAVSCITDIAFKVPYYQPGQGNFAQWVRIVARHKLADYLRSVPRTLPLAEGMAEKEKEDSCDPREEAAAAAVRKALGQLDERDQEIVTLKGSDWATFEEIGRDLALSPGATRVRYHRALKRLAAILAADKRVGMRMKR